MIAYYNEIDPYAAAWLRNLIAAGHIAPGDVDERSIADVLPSDLAGYTQCHFFAGIGGWSLAARLAGWPDDRPLWTGSCPCQPFSVAGKGEGAGDVRHLWPVFFTLISACRPDVVMGEQVAAAVGKDWLDGVHSDLEGIGYACGAAVVPACAVDAPHRRDRLWFVADSDSRAAEHRSGDPRPSGPGEREMPVRRGGGAERRGRNDGHVVDANDKRREELRGTEPIRAEQPSAERAGRGAEPCGRGVLADPTHGHDGLCVAGTGTGREPEFGSRRQPGALADTDRFGGQVDQDAGGREDGSRKRQVAGSGGAHHGAWDGASWITGADGKARRAEPGIRLLAHGISARVGKLRAFGNAIVPQVAAEVIGAYLDAELDPKG